MRAVVCYEINYFHTIMEIPKPRVIHQSLGRDYPLEKAYMGIKLFELPLASSSTKKCERKNKEMRLTTWYYCYTNLFLVVLGIVFEFSDINEPLRRLWIPAVVTSFSRLQFTFIFYMGRASPQMKIKPIVSQQQGRSGLAYVRTYPKNLTMRFRKIFLKMILDFTSFWIPSPSFYTWLSGILEHDD